MFKDLGVFFRINIHKSVSSLLIKGWTFNVLHFGSSWGAERYSITGRWLGVYNFKLLHSHFHLSITCLKGLSNLNKCRFSIKLTVDVTLVFHAIRVYSKTVKLIKFLWLILESKLGALDEFLVKPTLKRIFRQAKFSENYNSLWQASKTQFWRQSVC
jgi:hypothetical protein